jgi:hypothetical protein
VIALRGFLVGLALALCAAVAAPSAARAQTFAEAQWFDRARHDCDGFMDPDANCTYRWRLLLHLEQPPFEGARWFRLLARIEILSRRSSEEPGHFDPLKADLGGGVVLAAGAWSATFLMSSLHCMDVLCDGDTYNSITLRWSPDR